jgi:hypothetical protein
MLTEAQRKARDGKVTASFVPYLMTGDETKILNEWRRLVGDPGYAEDNLDDVWAVQFGSYIESFALDWHQRKTGQSLTRRGEVVVHPQRPYVCCTLDAHRESDGSVIDVKAIGAYRKLDDVAALYLPQLIVQRACVGAAHAALLIVHGGSEPFELALEIPPDYEAEVWRRIDQFWACCENLAQPIALAPVEAPVPAVKTYNMHSSNAWAEHAGVWIETHAAAKRFDTAAKELKALVPADAKRAFGHGVNISRSTTGALAIKQEKAA